MVVATVGVGGEELRASEASRRDFELLNISKSYASRLVLDDVSLTAPYGQIVGIVGHNGSGKSTLLNIAAGLIRPDAGCIQIEGRRVEFTSVRDARQAGIVLMSQTGALFPDLSVLENVFAGAERMSKVAGIRLLQTRAMREEAQDLFRRLNIDPLPLDAPVATLSMGQRFIVGFLRVLRLRPKVLALDEPTAALGYKERTAINVVISDLARGGCGIVLVSHILDDVLLMADSVVVLQRGRIVYRAKTGEAERGPIVQALIS